MKTKIPASFEELIGGHYGNGSEAELSNTAKMEALLANRYGKPLVPSGTPTPAVALSLRCDDGETLPQRSRQPRTEEYVVSQSVGETAANEYIVEKGAMGIDSPPAPRPAPSAPEPSDAQRETLLDILQPLKAKDAAPPPAKKEEAPRAANPRLYASGPGTSTPEPNAAPQRQDDWPRPADKPLFQKEVSEAKTTEDDFIADMQSILTGQKVFDPHSKKTVGKEQLGQAQSAGPRQPEPNSFPPPPADNGQAIFDRIAQSMQYANAYDLGTVELENRFADFDKNLDDQKARAAKKPTMPAMPTTPAPVTGLPAPAATVDSADFLRDLDAIHRQYRAAPVPANTPAPSSATAMSVVREYSRPFYDTGEHVLTGGDLYPDQLHVGRSPGVAFSYGQIVAMADLYESYDQMMGTDVGELTQIKAKIESSTRYYQSNKADKTADVSNKDWNTTTNGRYMRLALDNFEHFSPNLTLLGKAGVISTYQGRDHKTAWEQYHRAALEAAARLFAANPNLSSFPETALTLNAFGDHFLTDAFAAGHSLSKAEMFTLYKANFYSGSALNSDGAAFFEKLASRAWRGKVKTEFSKLETADFKWYGPIPIGHPSIDSASMFARVLKGVAEQEPDQVANVVVGALHNRLNTDGIEVFNAAGDGTWRLTGDGTMDAKNLAIIRKAVQQSVDNVNEVAQGMHTGSPIDPVTGLPTIDFETLFARVWQHVPQLSEASRNLIQRLMREYTDPKSETLVTAAAQLVEDQVGLLTEMIVAHGDLRKA